MLMIFYRDLEVDRICHDHPHLDPLVIGTLFFLWGLSGFHVDMGYYML